VAIILSFILTTIDAVLLNVKKVKIKCTLVQALRLCTGCTAIGGVEV